MNENLPTIYTDRFKLRNITDSDIEHIFAGLSHPEVIRYYGINFDTLEATKVQMQWYAEPEQYWWAICSPENNTFFGAAGLNNLSSIHQKAEIGIWLFPSYWGQRIMEEIIPTLCNFGFEQLGLHRIEGYVESNNANCKKAMAKLDFIHEGTLVDYEIKNGQFISVEVYAILNNSG